MKTTLLNCTVLTWVVVSGLGRGQGAGAATADANPQTPEPECRLIERGPHHGKVERTVWETSPDGEKLPHTSAYIVLNPGMHYQEPGQPGVWHESNPGFELEADGYVVARRGRCSVRVAPNINTSEGVVELTLADGRTLKSAILGLNLFDSSGKSLQVAAVRDATGQLTAENEITWFDCFEGLRASVRIRNEINQFHQEVLLEEKLTDSQLQRLGFANPADVRLEIWTEFLKPPLPQIEQRLVSRPTDQAARSGNRPAALVDHLVDFGAGFMPQGKAFVEQAASNSVPVLKQWLQNDEGRVCLVESAGLGELAPLMRKLPASKMAALTPRKSSDKLLAGRVLPARTPPTETQARPMMRLAAARRAGPASLLVADYVLITSSLTNAVFKGDTTYLITNAVPLRGKTRIEGNSVIKFSSNPACSPGLVLYGPLECLTGPYRPAVLTSSDDNAVGATISGSSGSPATIANAVFIDAEGPGTAGSDWTFQHLRVAYAFGGLLGYDGLEVKFQNCQFLDCAYACGAPFEGNVKVQNCLFSACDYPIYGNGYISAEHVTAAGYTSFAQCLGIEGYVALGLGVTNSLVVGPAAWIGRDGGSATLPTPVLDHTTNLADGTGVFQRAGAGDFYLAADSPYRNAGTTNIAPSLLATLRQTTTYPPLVYSNATLSTQTTFSPQAQRDTDQPDLGYHYCPLDYTFGGCTAQTNLLFTPGTAAAWFRTSSGWQHAGHGIHLADSRQITFDGRATAPAYWVRYNTVQEGVNGLWAGGYGPGGITGWAATRALAPVIQARFLRASVLGDEGGSVNHFRDDYGYLIVRANHCEFWSGGLGAYVSSHYHTNCLFERTWVWLENGQTDNEYIFRNCTFKGNFLSIHRTVPTYVSARDCIFDETLFPWGDAYTNYPAYTDYGYNAFLSGFLMTNRPAGPNDLFVTNFNWQTSWLGRFYLPTNSPLINTGMVSAGLRGLYHFTTQTNQVKEAATQVDRGYHYVAVDNSAGSPLDWDGDGLPDYVEDANGNGSPDAGETDWQGYTSLNGLDATRRFTIFTPLK